MKILFSFLIFNFLFLISFSQGYDPKKVNEKASGLYSKALNELTQNKNYKYAIQLMDEAIAIEPDFADAWLSKAAAYADIRNYPASVASYEAALKIDAAYFSDSYLPYSISLAGTGAFQKALDAVNEFLKITGLNERSVKAANYRKRCYEFAVNYANTHSNSNYVFRPINLGDSINTKDESEYFPSLTVDGNELIFTRLLKGVNEDFFVSYKKNNQWSKAIPLPGNINTELNEGAQNISQDGKMLVFTGCNFPGGNGSCDLYYSLQTPKGWSEPLNFGEPINTEFWESQPSISPDKRFLYFTARDPNGLGGSDIWVSERSPNGTWKNPINLGPGINTAGNESDPFIHADNQTLYFTSDALPGYGGRDLFVVRKDSAGKWGKPENLGYPINTINDESTFIVSADSKTAYYSSGNAEIRGGLDIYSFELREDIRPGKTLWVKGNVYDKKTIQPLPSAVELLDLKSGQTISKLQTDESGNYLITLPVGKNYAFNVNRKGYLFYSDNFSLSKNPVDSVYTKDIPLQPIELNASIVLKNIFFDTKKFDLKPESMIELDKVVQLMKDNPNIKILIGGHTDNVGKAQDNLTLSNARAKSAINYLLYKGVRIERLQWKGFGSSKPVADNKTETGKAQNRRTELTVVGL
ncbi:MAG: OmpA family protein [Sphingobacteriales bacterium]|nr:OmpA family protein [Sphingobacteriales bacterium]